LLEAQTELFKPASSLERKQTGDALILCTTASVGSQKRRSEQNLLFAKPESGTILELAGITGNSEAVLN